MRYRWPFLIALIPVLFVACGKQGFTHEQVTEEDTYVEIAENVEILYSDSAMVRVRITSPRLHHYNTREDARQEFRSGVKVEFLNPDRSVSSTLIAKKGVRYQEKGQIFVRDSVVFFTAKNEKLETEELIWDEQSEKIFTEKFVKVTKPGEVIYGYGLEANQDFTYWKITIPKGRIKVDPLDQALQQ